MSIKDQLESTLLEVFRVISKPDNGKGGDWWVGLDLSIDRVGLGKGQGIWDDSCPDKKHAQTVRKEICRDLAKFLAKNLTFTDGAS
jgi:hypothetical protein